MNPLLPSELITRKQKGKAHSEDEIEGLISGFLDGTVPDYQMAAWLMAVYFRGMTVGETVALTKALLNSGKRAHHNTFRPTADKHSTGGIGDKISLILAPLLAASGLAVPMISGRGLGFTGGTLDKLESIPGMRTDLELDRFEKLTAELGLAFGAQTDSVVPADKRIYALRDVTGTVRSLPLITSSILSKKLAEGIESIVFDVKCGLGAFMETREQALELAGWLVNTSERFSLKAAAVITSMNQPLGRSVGNWLEVEESVSILEGSDPPGDIVEVTEALGGTLLNLAGLAATLDDGISRLREVWKTGKGLETFKAVVAAQGGDVSVLDLRDDFNISESSLTIHVPEEGYVSRIQAREVGLCSMALGAGRKRAEDPIDPLAGILLKVKVGDKVRRGQPLAILQAAAEDTCRRVAPRLLKAFSITREKPVAEEIVLAVVTPEGEFSWQEYRYSKGMN